MLQGQLDNAQKTIEALTKPKQSTHAQLIKISQEEMLAGFNYPHDTLHAWINWQDNSLFLIVPIEKKPPTPLTETPYKP